MKAHPVEVFSDFLLKQASKSSICPVYRGGNTPGACERRVDGVFDMPCILRGNLSIFDVHGFRAGEFSHLAPWRWKRTIGR